MTNWIDINLPYSDTGVYLEDFPDPPDTTDDEREQFGVTAAELWDKHEDTISELRDKEDLWYTDVMDRGVSEEDWDKALAELRDPWLENHPPHREAYVAQKTRNEIRAWRAEHPKILAHQKILEDLRKADLHKTFKGRGLATPGTQIEMADGNIYLIGDVNPLGGTCDDCTAFRPTSIVARYRVLLDKQSRTRR